MLQLQGHVVERKRSETREMAAFAGLKRHALITFQIPPRFEIEVSGGGPASRPMKTFPTLFLGQQAV
jgi:hypothetical protein